MKWMGFGRGFVFELTLNAWTEAAREASLAARRATAAAKRAHQRPNVRANPYPERLREAVSLSRAAAKAAGEPDSSGDAARLHGEAANAHRILALRFRDYQESLLDPNHPKAELHRVLGSIAELHEQAAETHRTASARQADAHKEDVALKKLKEQDAEADDTSHIYHTMD